MDTNSLSRRTSRIKISRNAEGQLLASGTATTEPINNSRKANGYLIASYPKTKASIEFSSRKEQHRDDEGNLLDKTRQVDRNGLIDTNQLIDPARATHALKYIHTDPYFTPTEHLKFALAYQDTPARFGEIAAHLPGRTSADCIDHYYRYKSDGRFKNESRKKRYHRLPVRRIDGVVLPPPQKELMMGNLVEWDIRLRGVKAQVRNETVVEGERFHNSGRRMRGKTEVLSYSNEVTDDDLQQLIPLNMHITELKEALDMPRGMRLFEKTKPAARRERVVLPQPFHLEILSKHFQHPSGMTENKLKCWLRSRSVLPLIKECSTTFIQNGDLQAQLVTLFDENNDHFPDLAGDLAHLAQTYKLWSPHDLEIDHQEILVKLAQFAYRIGQANLEFLSELHKPNFYPEQNLYFDSAFVLLFALKDLVENEVGGFFATLLESELAGMVKSTARRDWERLYSFEREEESEGNSTDPIRQESGPLTRSMEEWNEIFKYEGKEGRQQDWDANLVVGPTTMIRKDSGMGGK